MRKITPQPDIFPTQSQKVVSIGESANRSSPEEDEMAVTLSDSLLVPEKPFSNKKKFREAIEYCNEYIYWVDKYFSVVGLNLLSRV